MIKKIILGAAGFLVLLICAALIYFQIDFSSGQKKVAEFYKEAKVEKIRNLGSTKTLEILPLIDWYTDDKDLKGEAGVSYLVKTDDSLILFDVGFNAKDEDPSSLLQNMKKLGVALDKIDTIVISHNHLDHIGGFKWGNKKSFSLTGKQIDLGSKRVYVPVDMTYPGLKLVTAGQPTILSRGVATTGTLPSHIFFMGWTPEQSLAINVAGKGIVLIVGCGHQTVPRLIERTRLLFDEPIVGIVAGLHYPVTEGRLKMAGIPMQKFFGTGKPPWSPVNMEDVNRNIDILKKHKLEIVSLSPHDSCDASIAAFKKAFPSAYQDLKVGKKLVIGEGEIK